MTLAAETSHARTAPRRTVHRGVVLAVALWFSDGELAPGERVLRIARNFRPSCRVHRARGGLLLELEAARRFDARECPALPLELIDGIASSAPLRANERPPGTAPGDWVIVEAGRARRVTRVELEEIDPADFVDVSAYGVEPVAPLAEERKAPPAVKPGPTSDEIFDQRIGRKPEDRAERDAVTAALAALGTGGTGRPPARAGLLLRLHAWFLGWIARRRERAASQNSRALSGATGGASKDARAKGAPQGIGTGEHWFDRLDRWLRTLLLRSWLGQSLARKQAEYLRQLLELLDAKRDLEALKWAIPLGGGGPGRPALSAPSPRTSLEISLAKGGASSSIVVADDLFAELRARYEAIFERLDEAGRFEDAAFVLAELLDDAARAVAYLERHGRLELAAELAEARKLEPSLLVRQWFLAKNVERAIAIAARHGVFFDAIRRLEASGHAEEARKLSLLYANRLAQAGFLVAAANQALSAGESLLALSWLEVARDVGDVRGVALELSLAEERFDVVWQSLQPLLLDGSPDGARGRVALGRELAARETPVARPIARELVRRLYADGAMGGDLAVGVLARRLALWVGGAFQADAPNVIGFERRLPESPVKLAFTVSDVGRMPVVDLFKIGTRLVLALGEAGVRFCDRRGKELAHFDVPADQLVVAKDSPHLLALAARGDVQRVSRIHLGLRRSEAVIELRARAFAPSFDGERWVVVEHDAKRDALRLLLLDMVSERPAALESVSLPEFAETGGVHQLAILDLEATDRAVSLIACASAPFAAPELLRYELPSFTLRERVRMLGDEPNPYVFIGALSAAVGEPVAILDAWIHREPTPTFRGLSRGSDRVWFTPELFHSLEQSWPKHVTLEAQGGWFVLALARETGTLVVAGSFKARRVTVELELNGARTARVRLAPPLLFVGDSAGRALVFDLEASRLVNDLRS
jgi:phage anti-repressor protein